jgi:hypothetical protein
VGAAFDDLLLCCTAVRPPAPPEMCAVSMAAARWPRLLVADLDDLRLRGTDASPPSPPPWPPSLSAGSVYILDK